MLKLNNELFTANSTTCDCVTANSTTSRAITSLPKYWFSVKSFIPAQSISLSEQRRGERVCFLTTHAIFLVAWLSMAEGEAEVPVDPGPTLQLVNPAGQQGQDQVEQPP